ncbi:MAG: M28 family peptidase [Candidatus Hodarchaeota archaeon]
MNKSTKACFLLPIVSFMVLPSVSGSIMIQEKTDYHLQFSKSDAWNYLEDLMAFNPRYPGTPGINQTAEYIKDVLGNHGATVFEHDFQVSTVDCKNIIGKWTNNPNATQDVIILASHYDARALADNDPDVGKRTQPVPAANDGGSSTAALLELSGIIEGLYNNIAFGLAKETWLVFFDAEDQGGGGMPGFYWIEGSTKLAADIDTFLAAGADIEMFILLDMIGDDDLSINQELNSNQDLLTQFFGMGQCLGYSSYFSTYPSSVNLIDDHKPFKDLGIPSIDIIDFNYPEWHTTTDDLDHVSSDSIGGVGRVAEAFYLRYIFPNSSLAIHDDETGKIWEEGSCSYASWYMEFIAFLSSYWMFLVFGVLVLVVGVYAWKKKKRKRKLGEGEEE